MTKLIRILRYWLTIYAKAATAIEIDGQIKGMVYLYHTGSIVSFDTVHDQQKPTEVHFLHVLSSFDPR